MSDSFALAESQDPISWSYLHRISMATKSIRTGCLGNHARRTVCVCVLCKMGPREMQQSLFRVNVTIPHEDVLEKRQILYHVSDKDKWNKFLGRWQFFLQVNYFCILHLVFCQVVSEWAALALGSSWLPLYQQNVRDSDGKKINGLNEHINVCPFRSSKETLNWQPSHAPTSLPFIWIDTRTNIC